MRKVLFIFVALFTLSVANAQTGKNQVGLGLELGLPMGDFSKFAKLGFGGSAKYLHGVGSAGQITLTAGYISFGGKKQSVSVPGFEVESETSASGFIPVMAGYRHNFDGLYVEPQLGYLKSTAKGGGGAFSYAIGGGYALESGLDLGVRYHAATKDGSTTSFIGFRVGYNFSLGGSN